MPIFTGNYLKRPMAFHELRTQITALVSKDQLEEAVRLLAGYYDGQEKAAAIAHISGRLAALNQGLAKGLIGFPEYYQARNQLRASILELVKEEEEVPRKNDAGGKVDASGQYQASLARVAVVLILFQEQGAGLAITSIHQASKIKGRKYVVAALQEMEANGWVEKNKSGKINHWRLTEEGRKLAGEFSLSVRAILGLA